MAAVPCPRHTFVVPAAVGIFILRVPPPGPLLLLQINLMSSSGRNFGAVLFLLILISRNVINYQDKIHAINFY